MTIEELKRWQERDLREFRRKARSDRAAAAAEAARRLRAAGIIDGDGRLAAPYRQ